MVRHHEGVTPPAAALRFTRAELEAVPPFRALDAAGWDQLLTVAWPESPADGECVQYAGQRMGRVAVVLAGGLRIVHAESDGRSRVVRLLGPGEQIGETELVLHHPPVHSALAAPDTRLCVIGHDEFEALAAANPTLVRAMLETTYRRLLATELLLSSQVADDVQTRLISFLLSLPGLPSDSDSDSGSGRRRIVLPSSQIDVASYLGTTPETLSRQIRKLVDSGMVDRFDGRGAFALDVPRLTGLLQSR